MYAALLLVPFMILLLTIVFITLNGPFIKNRTGTGIIRQIYEQIRLATRYAILSPWYYIFELQDEDKREHTGEYLNRFEIKAGIYKLRKYNGGLPIPVEHTTACIKNKACLKVRCNDKGIATTPIFWNFKKGQIRKIDWQDEKLPEWDLFIKPLAGQGGGGTSRWDYLGSGRQYRGGDGMVAAGEQLIKYLRTASEHKTYLVQSLFINHREITNLADDTLATIRVMSCRNESDHYEVTDAVFRMARSSKTVVDNYHASGITANVDIQTGELGRGIRGAWVTVADGWYDRHPETNVPILHRRLPCWPELIRFVQDAHGCLFSDQVVIGWEVAILDTGPFA